MPSNQKLWSYIQRVFSNLIGCIFYGMVQEEVSDYFFLSYITISPARTSYNRKQKPEDYVRVQIFFLFIDFTVLVPNF